MHCFYFVLVNCAINHLKQGKHSALPPSHVIVNDGDFLANRRILVQAQPPSHKIVNDDVSLENRHILVQAGPDLDIQGS